MGQLWDRLRRVGESYINDFNREDPDYSNIDPKVLEELRRRAHSPGFVQRFRIVAMRPKKSG